MLPPADERKPDSTAPWRYVCPDCDGQVVGVQASRVYRCVRCKSYHPAADLHDQTLDRPQA
jgi:ribosomal protein L37AE/L43A